MKKIFLVLLLFIGFNGLTQTDEDNEYWIGVHLEEAGKCRNKAMAATAAGLAAGGGLIFGGVISDQLPLTIGGGIVSLGFTISAIAYNIQANNHLKKAGKLMRKET